MTSEMLRMKIRMRDEEIKKKLPDSFVVDRDLRIPEGPDAVDSLSASLASWNLIDFVVLALETLFCCCCFLFKSSDITKKKDKKKIIT